jgi:hypothetical protein
LVTVKNEDKLEFSEILEAIKVMQNYMSCIFCVTIEAVFGCFNLTSIIFFLFLVDCESTISFSSAVYSLTVLPLFC